MKCFKCQANHHVSLCSKNEQLKDAKQEEENGAKPAHNMFVGQSRESVLLQTSTVTVVRPDNQSYSQGCGLVSIPVVIDHILLMILHITCHCLSSERFSVNHNIRSK